MADDLDGPLTRFLSHQLLENPTQYNPFLAKDSRWHPKNRFTLSPGDPGSPTNDRPFLRCYDLNSGSYPDSYGRMLARKSRMRLDSREQRRNTLQGHRNYYDWTETPYISFTNSPMQLRLLAEQRRTGAGGTRSVRPHQMVVVVDPVRRYELGLPMVNYADALEQYQVPDEGNNRRHHHREHYLCLWEVTPEEVVGIWPWNELRFNANWYDEIILPAVEEFRARQSEEVSDSDEGVENEPDTRYYCDSGERRPEDSGDFYYVSSDDDETRCANNWAEQSWKEYEDN